MDPWKSWAAALVIGGAAAYYYGSQGSSGNKRRGGRPLNVSEQPAARRRAEPRNNASPGPLAAEADTTGVDIPPRASTPSKQKKRKAANAAEDQIKTSQPSTAPQAIVKTEEQDADFAREDREWAEQLNAAKQGVNLAVPSSKRANGRTVSPSRLAASESAEAMPSAGDVSDMLEPSAPGPSSIRITGSEKPKATKQNKPAAQPAQETKKQRQHRKKAEEQKQLREETEVHRKVLEEQQRRTAREARGEPAKNGLAAPAPTSNAWAKGSGTITAAAAANAPLLDTFEQDAASTASSNEVVTNNQTPATTSSSLDLDSLPSEEEQMQMLNGDAGWNEVTSKKGKKKAGSTPKVSSPTLGPVAKPPTSMPTNSLNTELPNGSAKTPKSTTQKATANTSNNPYAALEAATGFTPLAGGHPDDSEWAVE